jgi:hypothetical protein
MTTRRFGPARLCDQDPCRTEPTTRPAGDDAVELSAVESGSAVCLLAPARVTVGDSRTMAVGAAVWDDQLIADESAQLGRGAG